MKRLLGFLAIAGGIGLATVTNAAQTPAKGQVAPAKPPSYVGQRTAGQLARQKHGDLARPGWAHS